VGLARDPSQALEPVEQRGDRSGAQRHPVSELPRRDRPRRLDVVHGLELGRADAEAARHDRVQTVILQPEAPQRRKEFSGRSHRMNLKR
jgi:hypothetical protein